jgi:hypothetical protein
MSLFKSNELFTQPEGENPAKAIKTKANSILQLGKKLEEMQTTFGELEMGNTYQFVTMGKWSMHEVLEYCLRQLGPSEVFITTWTLTEDPARLLVQLKEEGLIRKLNCLFDYRIKDRKPEPFYLVEGIADEVKLSKCHAKLTVLRGFENRNLTIMGSANYSRNPRIETGAIFTDKETAMFHSQWIMDEINDKEPFRPLK